ncbi:diguanylate cyclase [Pseudomonas plecoglossicida]|nr:diguanylate cyclase [Pseudomonas sp. MR 02]PLU96374.1 diguanylate cyclase [Pseudomonas plecoglossicida]PLV04081.1 diguanylate cyclase [Pseudomonas plecoglossicida]
MPAGAGLPANTGVAGAKYGVVLFAGNPAPQGKRKLLSLEQD